MAEQSLGHLYKTKSDIGHTHTGAEITSIVSNATNADKVPFTGILDKPTTLAGYGITDTYTKSEIDAQLGNISSALSTIIGG